MPKAPIGFKSLVTEPGEIPRRSSAAPGLGKWQRGVALPPPDENSHRRGSGHANADNPNDLWDDPLAATDAAADFSAFGAIPDDPKDTSGEAFDFNKMTEASQKFDDEMRGITRSPGGDDDENGDDNGNHSVSVNPNRPLASSGTTIRSGSGDDVNVFEDFDDNPQAQAGPVKAADEDPSASSRLMKMIGVDREETTLSNQETTNETKQSAALNPWAAASGDDPEHAKPADGLGGIAAADIPSNPWGQSIVGNASDSQQSSSGFDLAARLEQAAAEQKQRDDMQRRQSQQEAELLRRRQEDEAQRRAMEERARQQAMQQQQHQQPGGHSQVELVLMERISVILENSWGRSDLVSILTTLHSEDSRVVPLLGNVEALRALLARHPSRIALRQDPAFGTEMAVLLLNNAQFQQRNQQQQQEMQEERRQRQEAQARAAQQEEIRRREQQIRMQQQANQNGGRGGLPQMVPDAPWFYSDPQNNIQVRNKS